MSAQATKAISQDPDHHLYRRGQAYYIRFELAGREQRQSLGTSDVKAARKARDKLLKEAEHLRRGGVIEREKTWQDAVDGYLALTDTLIANKALSKKTAARYSTSIVQLTEALAGDPNEDGSFRPVPLSQITIGSIRDFVSARHDEGCSPSTILNDLTACSRVLAFAIGSGWLENNVAKNLDRRMFVGSAGDEINPPTDEQAEQLIAEVTGWRADMGLLLRFLRETGMRLGEALSLRAEDIHPDGIHATLRHGVKRNKDGLKTRTINLGRAATFLSELPKRGRVFASLHADSAVVSTRYGQWRRQRQGREERSAASGGRAAEVLQNFRLHDLRHAFAIASLIDDSTCIYRLSEHLGHSSIKTTEIYLRFLKGSGAQRRYERRPELFGSLPVEDVTKAA